MSNENYNIENEEVLEEIEETVEEVAETSDEIGEEATEEAVAEETIEEIVSDECTCCCGDGKSRKSIVAIIAAIVVIIGVLAALVLTGVLKRPVLNFVAQSPATKVIEKYNTEYYLNGNGAAAYECVFDKYGVKALVDEYAMYYGQSITEEEVKQQLLSGLSSQASQLRQEYGGESGKIKVKTEILSVDKVSEDDAKIFIKFMSEQMKYPEGVIKEILLVDSKLTVKGSEGSFDNYSENVMINVEGKWYNLSMSTSINDDQFYNIVKEYKKDALTDAQQPATQQQTETPESTEDTQGADDTQTDAQ